MMPLDTTRSALRLRLVRRGALEWSLPEKAAEKPVLRELLRRVFAVRSVRRVRFERATRRLRVEYDFLAERGEVLQELSLALRGRSPVGLPEIAAAALELPVISLERAGEVISSWKIRLLPGPRMECRHAALAASPAALFTIEQAVALLRGVQRVSLDRKRGTLVIRFDPAQFHKGVLVATLESAIGAERPTAGYLPPTRRGYGLDAVQITAAVASPMAPALFIPLSALLLAVCYRRQIRAAVLAARQARCDWNVIVTVVVGLTIWSGSFLPAALMSLALRGWRSIEHRKILDVLSRMRRSGLSPLHSRWLARAAFSRDDSGPRSVEMANAVAWPVLAFGAIGLVAGGPISALAAVRPDFLTAPRLGNRLEGLRALSAFAARGVLLSSPLLCRSFLRARALAIHSSCLAAGNNSDWPRPSSRRFPIIIAQDAVALEMLVKELPASSPPLVYVGPPLDWSAECRARILWCQPEQELTWREDADAHLEGALPGAMAALFQESARHERRRGRIERLPLAGNGLLTAAGAVLGVPPWVIAVGTNAITSVVWLNARGRWPVPGPRHARSGENLR